MVRFLKRGNSLERLVHGRSMVNVPARQAQSPAVEVAGGVERVAEGGERTAMARSQWAGGPARRSTEAQQAGYVLDRSERAPKSPLGKDGNGASPKDRPSSGKYPSPAHLQSFWL